MKNVIQHPAAVDLQNVSMILRTDSYKVTHWLQYPPGTRHIYSYGESRGGVYPTVTFFGLQYYLKTYLMRPITMADVDYAEKRFNLHFQGLHVFNRPGWQRIVKLHGGYMPVRIDAVPEGLTVGTRNVLFTIENLDPELPWVTNYVETLIMKVWYPTTVATQSRAIRELILDALEETGTPGDLDFKFVDFGYRGASSEESAAIGGMAHLAVGNMASDTFIANEAALLYYDEEMASFGIPAAEHSTIMAWGKEHEGDAFENMIKQFGSGPMYAVVSDTNDIFFAVDDLWGQQLKAQVLAAKGCLIIRPDSGVPHEVVRQIIEILGRRYGYTLNDKGFKVLNKVRILQGDGIDYAEIDLIIKTLIVRGWSLDNVSFGMGGALLQRLDRDTQKFAIKASQVQIGERIDDIYKSPIGDNTKRSKAGRLKLVWTESGFETYNTNILTDGPNVLRKVYTTGTLHNETNFASVRSLADLSTTRGDVR